MDELQGKRGLRGEPTGVAVAEIQVVVRRTAVIGKREIPCARAGRDDGRLGRRHDGRTTRRRGVEHFGRRPDNAPHAEREQEFAVNA